jgi:hypothetical protein
VAYEAHLGVEAVEGSQIAVVGSWLRSLRMSMKMNWVVAGRKKKAAQIDLLLEWSLTCSQKMRTLYQCQLLFCQR